jgi:hypothetical protein
MDGTGKRTGKAVETVSNTSVRDEPIDPNSTPRKRNENRIPVKTYTGIICQRYPSRVR